VEKLERKKQYICNQFYHSFDESIGKVNSLEERQKSLGDLCKQLKQYVETLDKAINTYRKQVIAQIEIPFFLYSSRLLQSYPGGQGVLIDSKEGDKVRFTAPGKEHDVLYTMSSGQLSAVLLAFELSLNRIYTGNGFQTLLIDDPIQCMDDINMVSLVELLGREFGQSQVILSTHEDDFARFIGYKYGKYGLNHKAISLKRG
jgi:exonuclease SbcC